MWQPIMVAIFVTSSCTFYFPTFQDYLWCYSGVTGVTEEAEPLDKIYGASKYQCLAKSITFCVHAVGFCLPVSLAFMLIPMHPAVFAAGASSSFASFRPCDLKSRGMEGRHTAVERKMLVSD